MDAEGNKLSTYKIQAQYLKKLLNCKNSENCQLKSVFTNTHKSEPKA